MEDDRYDQYEQDHAAEYQADDAAKEVLRAVGDTFRDAKHLVIIGPFDDERVCEVQFTDAEDAELAPKKPIRANLRGAEREIKVRISLRSPPVLLSNVSAEAGIDTAHAPPTGRSMGGDAIWHANKSEHGTAAFFANKLSVSATRPSGSNPPPVFNDAVLSCRHVLAGLQNTGGEGDSVSMILRPNGLTLRRKMGGLLDVAIGTVVTPADYHYCQVRALGKVAEVRRPHRRMRVHKYGARTGLTTSRIGAVRSWQIDGQSLNIFEVTGWFACVHDSGAAVVDDERKLVGMVFSGLSADCNLNTMTYVLAAAPFKNSPPNETFYVDYS